MWPRPPTHTHKRKEKKKRTKKKKNRKKSTKPQLGGRIKGGRKYSFGWRGWGVLEVRGGMGRVRRWINGGEGWREGGRVRDGGSEWTGGR